MTRYKLIRATLALALLGALVFGPSALAHDPDDSAQTKSAGKVSVRVE